MHATVFLRKPPALDDTALVVLSGGERHLKLSSLAAISQKYLGADDGDDLGLLRFDGTKVDFKTVRDELFLVSMFSTRKAVLVEDAEEFVTNHRPLLENYVDHPSRRALLILDVKTWRANTKLAKKLDKCGRAIDCSELAGGALEAWLVKEATAQSGKTLQRDAAKLMVELAGAGMGQLNQELTKLITYVGDRPQITPEDVRLLVGGWRAETTWAMIDAIRDGHPGDALAALGKLLQSGEAPQKILGGMIYVFKKFAVASEIARTGTQLRTALQQAGVFPKDLGEAEKYLRRIGRPAAERLLEKLALTDVGMKGDSRLPLTLQMELLVLDLCGAARPAAQR